MEVAAGDHRLILAEQQGVVRHRVELDVHLALNECQSIPDSTVDLRDTAQSVGVLDPCPLAPLQDLAAVGEEPEILRHLDLADVAPGGVHPLLEGAQLPRQRRQGQGADEVRQLGCLECVVEVQSSYTGHGTGTVGDAQALLTHQGIQRRDPRQGHGLPAGQFSALVDRLSPA